MICVMNMLRKPMTQKEILDLAHHNTLFSQIISLIPGHVFQSLERRHKTGRCSRQFGFKEQITIMAFIQVGRPKFAPWRASSSFRCRPALISLGA